MAIVNQFFLVICVPKADPVSFFWARRQQLSDRINTMATASNRNLTSPVDSSRKLILLCLPGSKKHTVRVMDVSY